MLKMPPVQYDLVSLNGGLDQVTPTLSLPPGFARRAANFECAINGGYTRIAGYERFDGRPSPSNAVYNVLAVDTVAGISVGDTVAGYTSGATAKVIAIDSLNVIITREVGAFLPGEQLLVGASPAAVIDDVYGVAADGLLDATYRYLASEEYRQDIAEVPGSGAIRGVCYYKGSIYAWRNSVDGLEGKVYRSSSTGWQAIDLGHKIRFKSGALEPAEGSTITGLTSGATATVRRAALESGTWSGSDGAGTFILSNVVGTFQDSEALTNSLTATYALADGTTSAITLSPGGTYEFFIANFGGGSERTRIYGVNGVDKAFEFDGSVLVPITTGMPDDVPHHVAVFKQHLFLSFGSSLQFSSIAEPYRFDPVFGAGELALAEDVACLLVLPGDQTGGAMCVYSNNNTQILYGSSAENFSLSVFNSGTGAYPRTAQNLDQAYALDDRGIMALGTSLNYGNFLPATLTLKLYPFIKSKRNMAVGSIVDREKAQYRVFYSDGSALYMTIPNGKLLGTMPVQFLHRPTCCTGGEGSNGQVTSFFGADNGFVYQMEAGTSFDGLPIAANIDLVFNSIRSPRILKRYRKASLELTGDSYADVAVAFDLGYRSNLIPQAEDATYSNDLRSSYWDSMIWDNFVWDGASVSPTEVELTGVAENIGARISSNSALFQPFTVNSVIVHYTPRRGIR